MGFLETVKGRFTWERIAIAALAALLVVPRTATAQTTTTNCQSLPFGLTSCTSQTFDPRPYLIERQRALEGIGKAFEQLGRDLEDVRERAKRMEILRLQEELLQKQIDQLNNGPASTVPAPQTNAVKDSSSDDAAMLLAVQAKCKKAYLGEAGFSKIIQPDRIQVLTSDPNYIRLRNGCRELGHWKASEEEISEAEKEAEYFQWMCQLSFHYAEFQKSPHDTSGSAVSFWDIFPVTLLLKEDACQPWGFWNAGEGAAKRSNVRVEEPIGK